MSLLPVDAVSHQNALLGQDIQLLASTVPFAALPPPHNEQHVQLYTMALKTYIIKIIQNLRLNVI